MIMFNLIVELSIIKFSLNCHFQTIFVLYLLQKRYLFIIISENS
jgi:hypothetical protein